MAEAAQQADASRATPQGKKAHWLQQRERGSVRGILFLVWCCNTLGRGPTRALLRVVMFYFTLVMPKARGASRAWLSFILDRPPTFWDVYRHICGFGFVTLDRIFLLQGVTDVFDVRTFGEDTLGELAHRQRGAVLFGSHIGSFDAMRALGDESGFDIRILSHRSNAEMTNRIFAALAPHLEDSVIELGSVGALLQAQKAIEEGACLALLADRNGVSDRVVYVDFLGKKAPMPAGPVIMANMLQAPMYTVFGVYRGGNRYDLHCELLCEPVRVPRGPERDAAVLEQVQLYADRLGEMAKRYPFSWFNFFDFWAPFDKA